MSIQSKIVSTLLLILLTAGGTLAQGTCPDIVQEVISMMGTSCINTARNQACYGNGEVIAISPEGAAVTGFGMPGDIAELVNIESLTLSELDEALDRWGMVLLQIQADLPDTLPGQNVTVLLFGDVEMANAGTAMDAFYFRSGVGTPACAEAPNGIMIQTPEGSGTINLGVNNVQIELGSTVYLTADPEDGMLFALIEGGATLGVGEDEVTVAGGEFSTIKLDEELNAIAAPTDPLPIADNLTLPTLPVQVLPRDISEFLDIELVGTGGEIIPRTGNWDYSTLNPTASEGCPPGFAQMMFSSMVVSEEAFIDFGGQPFDLQTFMFSNSGEALPGTFSNPEPNVQVWTMDEDGAHFEYSFRIISETHLEGQFVFDISEMNCNVTIGWQALLAE